MPALFRTAAFLTFTKESPHKFIPLAPGTYALAYRIVNPTTGQSGPVTQFVKVIT